MKKIYSVINSLKCRNLLQKGTDCTECGKLASFFHIALNTPLEPNSAVSHHSLQHIDGRFFLNVSFQVLQSLWAVDIDTGFQIPPQEKVTRGQIG
jgi:hypothetical protein